MRGDADQAAMIGELDHVNIETTDLDASVRFYKRVLGLQQGWRPDFDVPGAWLYVDDQPIVHLVVRETINPAPTGPIHHVALKATGLKTMTERLERFDVQFTTTVVPDLDVTQLFVEDPNGVRLELNFYSETGDCCDQSPVSE